MRSIDFFSDAFFPDWTGGLQRYATELAAAAVRHGFDGTLWTREWEAGGLAEVRATVGSGIVVRELLAGVPRAFRGPALTLAGLAGIAVGRPTGDCQIFHTSVLGSAFMRRRSSSPQIYVFHASAGHELLAEAASTGAVSAKVKMKARALLRLERSCLEKAQLIVVLSDFSKGLIRKLHPRVSLEKVFVIPGGSDVPPISSIEGSRRLGRAASKRIVVLRRLEWRMGIDMLLEAFAASDARKDGWQLDIVGRGNQEKSLRELSGSLGLSGSVTFHGRVDEPRKHQLLDGAALSVLPTRALEGFGLATVEAMGRGVIPIVTSVGASPEIVGKIDARLVCEPLVDDLKTAIDYWTLSKTDADRAELGSSCQLAAQSYGWDAVFAAYRKAIESLSSQGPQR